MDELPNLPGELHQRFLSLSEKDLWAEEGGQQDLSALVVLIMALGTL